MAGTHVNTFHDGKEVTGYFVPAVQGRGPGLLVLQEWWGLVPHVEDLCNRFAAEGFTCLAPDLYHGKTTKSPDEAGKLMMALNIEGALRDLMAAAAYLEAQSATTGERVGVVGFCMGGQLALYAACNAPEVGAAVDFYGIHPNVPLDFSRTSASFLGFFGGQDGMVTREVADALEARIKAAGRSVEFHHYPSAGHAFFNDTRPEAYNADAAKDAYARMLTFFRRELS